MRIYDRDGTERDEDWLWQEFGAVVVDRGDGLMRCVELRESEGPTAIVVTVRDRDDKPMKGTLVARWWPDPSLDSLPMELASWHEIGVYGETNDNGNIGFGMGQGDYYWPPDECGVSEVWVDYDSDIVRGLGMAGGTNHRHLDVVFQIVPDEPEPPEPTPEPPPDHNPLHDIFTHFQDGTEMSALEAHQLFGYQDVHQPDVDGPCYRLIGMYASEGPELTVTVYGADNHPAEGVEVRLASRSIMPPVRHTAHTDEDGFATFDLTADWLRYSAVDQQGPAAVGVITGHHTDVYNSAGVVVVTPARHFDLVFKLVSEPEPSPIPPSDFESEVLDRLDRIIVLLENV